MSKIAFTALCIIMFSCVQQQRTIYDLQEESLSSGVIVDTIMERLRFGMSREQVDTALFLNIFEKFSFNVPEFSDIDFHVNSHYFNDSLYWIDFLNFDKSYKYRDVLNIYAVKYGNPDTVIIAKEQEENYWLLGNLQVKVTKSDNRFSSLSIEYRDLRRDTYDRALITGKGNSYFDYFTPEYFEKYYKPKKIEQLKGI